MKTKIFYCLLFMGSLIMACEKTELDELMPQHQDFFPIGIEAIPDNVVDHLNTNFPDLSILKVEKHTELGFNILLDNHLQVLFDAQGEFLFSQKKRRNDDDDQVIPIEQLPAKLLTYIRNNYPNTTIVKTEFDDGRYNVYLSNGWELYFDANGNFLRAERDDEFIDPANLPAEIMDYIHNNYPNTTILKAEFDEGRYNVYLSNGWELYFDRNGNFLSAELDDEATDPANLPAEIMDYIHNNYPNTTILKAEFDEGRYNVYLSNGWELYFDANGNFLRAERDDEFIDPANLPAEIMDYIHNNYPDASIVKAEFDDGRYEILLDNRVELYFDRNGNFLFSEID